MCEDYPCCGHELGDCEGNLYGSDEAIKEAVYRELYEDEDGPEVEDHFEDFDEYGFLDHGDYY